MKLRRPQLAALNLTTILLIGCLVLTLIPSSIRGNVFNPDRATDTAPSVSSPASVRTASDTEAIGETLMKNNNNANSKETPTQYPATVKYQVSQRFRKAAFGESLAWCGGSGSPCFDPLAVHPIPKQGYGTGSGEGPGGNGFGNGNRGGGGPAYRPPPPTYRPPSYPSKDGCRHISVMMIPLVPSLVINTHSRGLSCDALHNDPTSYSTYILTIRHHTHQQLSINHVIGPPPPPPLPCTCSLSQLLDVH